MFIHNAPVEIPGVKLKTINENGVRFYLTEDGGKYPSITSVLSAIPEKRASIQKWIKRVGQKEANKISGKATRRGTVVHKICEDYLNNGENYIADAMPDAIEMFNSMKPVLDERLNNIHTQEAALYSKYLGVAGRVDCIAEWDGVPSVIDFKTSGKPKKEVWIQDYFMQCAGYAAMYYEMTDFPVRDVVVAVMVADGQTQIFKEKVANWLPGLKKVIDEFNRNH